MITLDAAKEYLRIDGEEEDSLLAGCMSAADAYMQAAISDYAAKYTDSTFSALADMVELALVSEFFRNRDASNDARDNLPYYIQSALLQLQTAEVAT